MLRSRFLAHEIHDQYYAHHLSRRAWDEVVLGSRMMEMFRHTMFRGIVPNLRRVGLLSERIQPRYRELGLLGYQAGKSAPELSAAELLDE